MHIKTKSLIRLYTPQPLLTGASIMLDDARAHYVRHVMRLSDGDMIGIFNAQAGEWLALVSLHGKRDVQLTISEQIAQPRHSPDLWLAFAPIKNKTDLVVEKATELGVSALLAVFTRHAVVRSINKEKLEAHAIEAAEQCERHDIPHIEEYKDLAALLSAWPKDRTLLYGDESGGGETLKKLLDSLSLQGGGSGRGLYGILIGPEGGFSAEEHAMLNSAPFVKSFSLGPRILRADTAAVAALACVQMWLPSSCEARSDCAGSHAIGQDPALALLAPQDDEEL